ncbi:MAG: 50S ribosomal protein L3 [Rhodothermales bacterium]|nr:50S ribosomal protein L3 [Rhodothermales bacterium]MCA0269352.1 50S ribosomal protein L3 [Bacteroidota bacterium]
MSGMIGKKLGMTSIFDETGRSIVCTVIEAGPNVVTQVKTSDGKDGYDAVQLGFGAKKAKRTTKALAGHFAAAGVDAAQTVREFRDFAVDATLGASLAVSDLFNEGEEIDVVGTSKGKGFQGVMRRHGFGGVGGATHGQHNRLRAPGSIGASSDPSRVFKGTRMAGRTGGDRVKVKNLRVVRILADSNLILVRGAVPGPKGSIVELHKKKTA